jgi:hypothetical protein
MLERIGLPVHERARHRRHNEILVDRRRDLALEAVLPGSMAL